MKTINTHFPNDDSIISKYCMKDGGFHVKLPSNSSMQYFSDNKTTNFLTKLSRTLQLDGEWEVGRAEIDYPHTWYNIHEGKNAVEI